MLPHGPSFPPQLLTAFLLRRPCFLHKNVSPKVSAPWSLNPVPSMEDESWGRRAVIGHPRPEIVEDIKGGMEWQKVGAKPGPIPK